MNLAAWVLVVIIHAHGTGATMQPADGVSGFYVPFASKEMCLAQRPTIMRAALANAGQDSESEVSAICIPTGARQ